MEARWNIKVDEEVDRELRIHLAESGLKRGALSRFVEEAVREKLLRVSVEEVKKLNAVFAGGGRGGGRGSGLRGSSCG